MKRVLYCALSPGGRFVATGAGDQFVQIWKFFDSSSYRDWALEDIRWLCINVSLDCYSHVKIISWPKSYSSSFFACPQFSRSSKTTQLCSDWLPRTSRRKWSTVISSGWWSSMVDLDWYSSLVRTLQEISSRVWESSWDTARRDSSWSS